MGYYVILGDNSSLFNLISKVYSDTYFNCV